MKLERLNFDDFSRYQLSNAHLRGLLGGGDGGTPTTRNGFPDGTNGPDFIDECEVTTFSNGTTRNDDVVK